MYNYELLTNQAPIKLYLIVKLLCLSLTNMVLDFANLVTNVAKPSLDLDQDETLNMERPPHPTNQNFFREKNWGKNSKKNICKNYAK